VRLLFFLAFCEAFEGFESRVTPGETSSLAFFYSRLTLKQLERLKLLPTGKYPNNCSPKDGCDLEGTVVDGTP
jgi:hypothetical protein